MTDAPTYADLELRYNGPIPQEALDRLRYGSETEAEIARTEDLVVYFRAEILRMRQYAKKWFQRGHIEMTRNCMNDSWLYLREWRALRRRLSELRGTGAAVKGAGHVLGLISEVMDEKEPGDG